MRIAIVGAGAIGCLLGSVLAKAGNEVTLVHRRRSVVQKIRESGVILHQRNGATAITHVEAELSPANLRDAELVIFTVKAFQTEHAAKAHKNRIGRAIVLTLQNGLGNVEVLSRVLGNNPILGGATTEASLLVNDGEVAHTGRGVTKIGELDRTGSILSNRIAQNFRHAGLYTRVSTNIHGVIWSKAIVNSAINPVSALTGLTNGMLLRSKELMDSMAEIVNEGVTVSEAEGVILDPPHPGKLLRRVLITTASNRSSMLQDLTRKRKTEVRQLNGAIQRIGRKHIVSTPLNQVLTSLILAVESSDTRKN